MLTPPRGVVSLCSPSAFEVAETGVASRVVKRTDAIRAFLNLSMEKSPFDGKAFCLI